MSFDALLGGLGLQVLIIEDSEALAQVRDRLTPRTKIGPSFSRPGVAGHSPPRRRPPRPRRDSGGLPNLLPDRPRGFTHVNAVSSGLLNHLSHSGGVIAL